MQNNYNNWFHLPPRFGYIQPASASPQQFIQQLILSTWVHRSKLNMQKSLLIWKETEKQKTREKWSAKLTELLWVENFKIISSSRCNQVWPKTADTISARGSSKTIKQCKVKIHNLKDLYKNSKDENKKTRMKDHLVPTLMILTGF